MKSLIYKSTFLIVLCLTISCESFLDTELDNSKVLSRNVYDNDLNAIAAMKNVYSIIRSGAFGGGSQGLSNLTGLSSDEVFNFSMGADYLPYQNNNLLADDPINYDLWRAAYKVIYLANDVLEEVSKSSEISEGVKRQLRGEAYFVRAMFHFYLVNLYGDIPIVTTTDYRVNASISRSDVTAVYNQIMDDLISSKSLLTDNYPEAERVRPNKFVASALLARVYLYKGDWENAEAEATIVINNSEYEILDDLNQVFLISSSETLWQLASEQGRNTRESYSLTSVDNNSNPLRSELVESFEDGDLRLQDWTSVISTPDGDVYVPAKYKAPYFSSTVEYTVMLRLADIILVRAEARAQNDDLSGAIEDLDVIRDRAGLDLIATTNPSIDKDDLLDVIAKERYVELFREGHRWFDLKRTDKASEVLQPLKLGWTENDTLYPIPHQERLDNPRLSQNLGY